MTGIGSKARWAGWCAGFGALVGSVALALGLLHNAQNEFFDTSGGQVDWGYCLVVFGTWFVAATASASLVSVLWFLLRALLAGKSR